jgi:hypothetical protein
MMNINFNPAKQPKGVLAQVLTLIVSAVLLVAALAFSAVFLAVIAVAGLILWIYFWWKTRALRAHLRLQMEQQADGQRPDFKPQAAEPASGDIIEGEAVRVVDEKNRLPE